MSFSDPPSSTGGAAISNYTINMKRSSSEGMSLLIRIIRLHLKLVLKSISKEKKILPSIISNNQILLKVKDVFEQLNEFRLLKYFLLILSLLLVVLFTRARFTHHVMLSNF